MKKRSVTIAGHRTSVSLEEAFWVELQQLAAARGVSVNVLVGEIDAARVRGVQDGEDAGGLSSALRLAVLADLKARARDR